MESEYLPRLFASDSSSESQLFITKIQRIKMNEMNQAQAKRRVEYEFKNKGLLLNEITHSEYSNRE